MLAVRPGVSRCFSYRPRASMARLAGAWSVAVLLTPLPAPPRSAVTFLSPLGDLYLSFDRQAPPATCSDRVIRPRELTPFQFYIGVDFDWADIGQPERNATDGASAMELSVEVPGSPLVVTSVVLQYDGGPFKAGAPDNFLWGFGSDCATGGSSPMWMIQYGALLLSTASDLIVRLGPFTPSTFDEPEGPGPTPGWVECRSTENLRPFEPGFAAEVLYINPSRNPCAVDSPASSWGTLKAAFGALP